jgi:hypothetical protein
MNNSDIEKLQAEIAELKDVVADLRRAFERNSDNTTDHVKSIYQYITDIHEYLMPVVHRVFPGVVRDNKQIDAFVKGRGRKAP